MTWDEQYDVALKNLNKLENDMIRFNKSLKELEEFVDRLEKKFVELEEMRRAAQ